VPVSQAPDPEGFDAVVCGSAIYATRWDKAARHYIRQHRQTLAERPTWLFESGPSGDAAGQRHQTSPSVLRLAEDIGSAPPAVFGGNLDPARARTRIARWVANSDLAGDYRNWDQIRTWADGIGRQVAGQVAG
jgi:menaquinone-dependent protoporphyrinogen oxidase